MPSARSREALAEALNGVIADWSTPQGVVSVDYFEREEFTAELVAATLSAQSGGAQRLGAARIVVRPDGLLVVCGCGEVGTLWDLDSPKHAAAQANRFDRSCARTHLGQEASDD